MSSEYYWPSEDEPGEYCVTYQDGEVRKLYWGGKKWAEAPDAPWWLSTIQMVERGWLGVRREKPDDAIYVSPERSTLAIEALAAFRACKQQPQFADWAFTFGPALCRELGAV